MRQRSHRRWRALSYRRRYAQITLAVLLGLALVVAFGGGRVRSAYNPPIVVSHQSATWGEHHVSGRAPASAPLFPSIKRRRSGPINPPTREARASRPGARRSASGY